MRFIYEKESFMDVVAPCLKHASLHLKEGFLGKFTDSLLHLSSLALKL